MCQKNEIKVFCGTVLLSLLLDKGFFYRWGLVTNDCCAATLKRVAYQWGFAYRWVLLISLWGGGLHQDEIGRIDENAATFCETYPNTSGTRIIS